MNSEEAALRERIAALEKQVQLLWGVLLRTPRLEGVHNTLSLESWRLGTEPLLPPEGRPGD